MVVTQAPKLNFIEVTNGWDGDVVSTDTYYPVRLLLVFNGLYSYMYVQVIQSNQGLYLVIYLYVLLLGSWWFGVVGRRHQRFANVHYKKATLISFCLDQSVSIQQTTAMQNQAVIYYSLAVWLINSKYVRLYSQALLCPCRVKYHSPKQWNTPHCPK